MEVPGFSDFREEIEKTGLTNPAIKFGNGTLKIITGPDLNDFFDLVILLLFSSVFLVSSSLLILSIISFGLFWYRLYTNFIGFDIFKIDFNTKTIMVRNRIFLINIARNIFGISFENKFSDVKEISNKESPLIDKLGFIKLKSRYLLMLESFKDPPVAIGQFKNEKEIERMILTLKKFVLNKNKL